MLRDEALSGAAPAEPTAQQTFTTPASTLQSAAQVFGGTASDEPGLAAAVSQALKQQASTIDTEIFGSILTQAFGARLSPAERDGLISQAKAGTLPMPAQIRFVDDNVLDGAQAAYSAAGGGTVFVNRDLKNDANLLKAAVFEEIGHHIDRQIGAGDAKGDEGFIFAQALRQGGPVDALTLKSARAERDGGTIEVDGVAVQVEFSAGSIDSSYQTEGKFSANALARGGAHVLDAQVDKALVLKFASIEPAPKTTDDVKAHLEANGGNYAAERAAAENLVLRPLAGDAVTEASIDAGLVAKFNGKALSDGSKVSDLASAKAYLTQEGLHLGNQRALVESGLLAETRDGHTSTLGQGLVKGALAAATLVRLRNAKIVGETDKLSTPLPGNVLGRVSSDPSLSNVTPKIKTYGQLLTALTVDANADGKPDINALKLARYLPKTSQQELLKALGKDVPMADLREKMASAGFDNPMIEVTGAMQALTLVPPKLFGLSGKSEIDKWQQQLLLRTGQVFIDENKDGKVDDDDKVRFNGADGTIQETSFKDLDPKLKQLVRYNMATAQACEEYAKQPFNKRLKFPHYNSSTGKSDDEKVNEKFWKVGTADKVRGQISWELNEDQRPSDGLRDSLEGNGNAYTTECAQGRTLLRLKGLRLFLEQDYGKGEGSFRFDSMFAKDSTNKATAKAYLQEFEQFKTDNAGKGWDDFVATKPLPELKYAMEVSRHYVLGAGEAIMQPWTSAEGESAAGNSGYFHNYSVSVLGVKIGYVGENVIDLGYSGGKRQFWGHPGGIQTESKWTHELAAGDIPVKTMADYGQYFSALDQKRSSERFTERRVEDLEKKNTELKENKPAGWEKKVTENEDLIGWYKALDAVRQAVADGFETDQIDAARKFYSSAGNVSKPEQMAPLAKTLTVGASAAMAKAFGELSKDAQGDIAKHFAVELSAMTDEQKTLGALYTTLVHGGRVHKVLKEEGEQALNNMTVGPWLKAEGKLASREAFKSWIATDEFKTWYADKAGAEFSGSTELAEMTTADVQKIVELAIPATGRMKTIYAQVNRRDQKLSNQMATMLKEGKLPDAEYKPEPTAVPNT